MNEYIKYEILKGERCNLIKLLKILYLNIPLRFVFFLRLYQWLNKKRIPFFRGYYKRKFIIKYGCDISPYAQFGKGIRFPHPNGIIIGPASIIGDNCTIFQQVTFGGGVLGDAKKNNFPKVGNNVVVFAGAKLIGNIIIGDNVIIGANSVVNKSFPSNSVIGGVPAKLLKELK